VWGGGGGGGGLPPGVGQEATMEAGPAPLFEGHREYAVDVSQQTKSDIDIGRRSLVKFRAWHGTRPSALKKPTTGRASSGWRLFR